MGYTGLWDMELKATIPLVVLPGCSSNYFKYSNETQFLPVSVPLLRILLLAMDISEVEAQQARRRLSTVQCVQKYAALLVSIVGTATASLVQSMYTREAYHTSALTGEAWVMELLAGHPERIRCELGVSHDVFSELIAELRSMGYGNSKFVSLEEKLAIFLYACVTGLTSPHVGERFQRPTKTINL